MSTEAALLSAIEQHPGEDTPRLVLADWYDEHDRPEGACDQRLAVHLRAVKAAPDDDAPRLEYAAVCERYGRTHRAEFIRVQCELARQPASAARLLDASRKTGVPLSVVAKELELKGGSVAATRFVRREIERLAALQEDERRLRNVVSGEPYHSVPHPDGHGPHYYARLEPGQWNRGFLSWVELDALDWFTYGDAILARHPLREARLRSAEGVFTRQVFARWQRKTGRDAIGVLLSECFRDLWGCELIPLGAPLDFADARDELLRDVGRGLGVPAHVLRGEPDPRFRELDAYIARLQTVLREGLRWQASNVPEGDELRNVLAALEAAREECRRAEADPSDLRATYPGGSALRDEAP